MYNTNSNIDKRRIIAVDSYQSVDSEQRKKQLDPKSQTDLERISESEQLYEFGEDKNKINHDLPD